MQFFPQETMLPTELRRKAAKGRGVRGKIKLAPLAAKSRVPGNEVLGGVGKLESL
jgi:hypothetical protein